MTECDVSRCPNRAAWLIRFVTSPKREHAYCDYHAKDRRSGELRWRDEQVIEARPL